MRMENLHNFFQALYILHACNNDVEKAKFEIQGYVNLDDEWTSDDDRVFWYAFNAFGKNFAKIKQLVSYISNCFADPNFLNHPDASQENRVYYLPLLCH